MDKKLEKIEKIGVLKKYRKSVFKVFESALKTIMHKSIYRYIRIIIKRFL